MILKYKSWILASWRKRSWIVRFTPIFSTVKIEEMGNRYIQLRLRGLELQETSCHSLEATRIDDIFDSAFEKRTLINHFPLHTLSPLSEVEVAMYADTRNLLTGVFNSTQTLQTIAHTFVESLVYYLTCYAMEKFESTTASNDDRKESIPKSPADGTPTNVVLSIKEYSG